MLRGRLVQIFQQRGERTVVGQRIDGSFDPLSTREFYSMAAFFKRIDTAVMGRKTYEMGLKLGGGNVSTPGIKNYVFSRMQEAGERDGLTFVNEPPRRLIEALRKKQGKDIWLMGGGELTREFLRDDLVDELYLGVVPVLIGEGIPAFPSAFPERKFVLVENDSYSKGLIALRYERRKGQKK